MTTQPSSQTVSSGHPLGWYLLMACLLFQGVSGIAGGVGLVSDPTGGNVGLPPQLLQGTPFNDYLMPGLILLCVLGIFPLVALYGGWKRAPWAWWAALLIGLALMIWIGVQISMIGYASEPPLQLIYGTLGLVIFLLTLLPSVRKNFSAP